jgi:hypothetical protein
MESQERNPGQLIPFGTKTNTTTQEHHAKKVEKKKN